MLQQIMPEIPYIQIALSYKTREYKNGRLFLEYYRAKPRYNAAPGYLRACLLEFSIVQP
ncbi:hypothetical protein M23134_06195 [Microscilla marina ATCC 23134]|uniref:Uncharacterized protein n=1 Tax=Microscilla marina ATCC 23134 TaxID=313606 RepID=A1ZVR9_MICM2|nr:hypothetical protein M23134_06195 [Microscilla marina ATCC 23134]